MLPIVTEEGLHRCMKALVLASKVCHEGYRSFTNRQVNGSVCVKRKVGTFFDVWTSPAITADRKRSKDFNWTPHEHDVVVALMDFPWIFLRKSASRRSTREPGRHGASIRGGWD